MSVKLKQDAKLKKQGQLVVNSVETFNLWARKLGCKGCPATKENVKPQFYSLSFFFITPPLLLFFSHLFWHHDGRHNITNTTFTTPEAMKNMPVTINKERKGLLVAMLYYTFHTSILFPIFPQDLHPLPVFSLSLSHTPQLQCHFYCISKSFMSNGRMAQILQRRGKL